MSTQFPKQWNCWKPECDCHEKMYIPPCFRSCVKTGSLSSRPKLSSWRRCQTLTKSIVRIDKRHSWNPLRRSSTMQYHSNCSMKWRFQACIKDIIGDPLLSIDFWNHVRSLYVHYVRFATLLVKIEDVLPLLKRLTITHREGNTLDQ